MVIREREGEIDLMYMVAVEDMLSTFDYRILNSMFIEK